MAMRPFELFLVCATLVGCSGGVKEGQSSSEGGGGIVSSGAWVPLIDGTWELSSGTEGYWCTRKTIAKDTYIGAYRAVAPTGTHHTLLLQDDGSEPDGEFPCGATLGAELVFVSGIGTDDFAFPEGVALKIPAGTQLLLNLHLFNTSASRLSGVSGTLVKALDASDVEEEAELILPGNLSFQIPPHGQQTVSASTTFSAASKIVSLWPHMHKYGVHSRVVHARSAGETVLHDAAYSFADQKNYPIAPLLVQGGESVRFTCSFDNPTPNVIPFGESSDAEMCFLGVYRYPKL